MSFTLTSSFAIMRKAGANANTLALASSALLSDYCDQAEGELCTATGYDWVSNYSSITTVGKAALSKAVAAHAAFEVAAYDMTGDVTAQSTTRLDVLRDIFTRITEILKDINNRKKIGATA